jgi:hypothetical protein
MRPSYHRLASARERGASVVISIPLAARILSISILALRRHATGRRGNRQTRRAFEGGVASCRWPRSLKAALPTHVHENLVETWAGPSPRSTMRIEPTKTVIVISEWIETILEIFGDLSVACTCGSGHIIMSSNQNQETDVISSRPLDHDFPPGTNVRHPHSRPG